MFAYRSRWARRALVMLGLLVVAGWPAGASGQASRTEAGFVCPSSAKPANMNFSLADLSGRDVSLAAYEGRVVLLDFWATWCGPCKVEIPWFVEFQNRYGPQGLTVLGVSVDDTADKLAPYATQFKMNYPVLQGLGHDDLMKAFGPMDGLPTTFVISREGLVCATHTGLGEKNSFESQIRSLLSAVPR